MQPASAEGSNSDTGRALRRYGPIAAIAVVALVVIGVVIAGGGDDASAPVTSDGTTEPDASCAWLLVKLKGLQDATGPDLCLSQDAGTWVLGTFLWKFYFHTLCEAHKQYSLLDIIFGYF